VDGATVVFTEDSPSEITLATPLTPGQVLRVRYRSGTRLGA
jgi:hypothetical protein